MQTDARCGNMTMEVGFDTCATNTETNCRLRTRRYLACSSRIISFGTFSIMNEINRTAARDALENAYKLDHAGEGRRAARELMMFIETSLSRRNLTEVERLLNLADVSKLGSHSLSGLIRSTARVREHLPAWSPAYAKAWDAVVQRGRDPGSLFVGLPEPSQV